METKLDINDIDHVYIRAIFTENEYNEMFNAEFVNRVNIYHIAWRECCPDHEDPKMKTTLLSSSYNSKFHIKHCMFILSHYNSDYLRRFISFVGIDRIQQVCYDKYLSYLCQKATKTFNKQLDINNEFAAILILSGLNLMYYSKRYGGTFFTSLEEYMDLIPLVIEYAENNPCDSYIYVNWNESLDALIYDYLACYKYEIKYNEEFREKYPNERNINGYDYYFNYDLSILHNALQFATDYKVMITNIDKLVEMAEYIGNMEDEIAWFKRRRLLIYKEILAVVPLPYAVTDIISKYVC